MKLKLDLHTHIWEAFNFQPPSLDIAEKVVAQIKSRGIDGPLSFGIWWSATFRGRR